MATCFSIADQNNLDLFVAKHNLSIAKAGIKIAGAIPNPQLQVQTGFGDSFEYAFTGQTQQAFLTEQIQTAGKRSKKISVARSNYTLSELQLDALRFDIHNRVRRAYAELAASEANSELIERQRDLAVKMLDLAKQKAKSENDSDVLQSILNVDQFEPQRNQAQGRLQQASANLSLALGVKPEHVEIFDVDDNGLFGDSTKSSRLVPAPQRNLPSVENLISTAFGARLDLKMAEERTEMNRRSLKLTRAERIPDLTLGSGFTFSTFAKNQPAGLGSASNYLGEGAFVTISTEAPVFYQHQGEIKQAISAVRQSDLQVDLLKSQIASGIISDYNALKGAQANLAVLREQLLPVAKRIASVSLDGYVKGDVDLSTAMVEQQVYQQTMSSYFDTVVAYQTAWADLERDVGVPLQN
ncbi:MAG TPA: TolC family protein [Drouetiella sp.]